MGHMNYRNAVTREPGVNLVSGLSSGDGIPDFELAQKQHETYCHVLKESGLAVTLLPPLSQFPDAPFIEDTAVLTTKAAIITRPGHPSRLGEEGSVQLALRKHFSHIERIHYPGTVDGGDVLQIGDRFIIGMSQRTNRDGATHLQGILLELGYTTQIMGLDPSILHLKSAVNCIGPDTVIITRQLAEHEFFAPYKKIVVNDGEENAANCLRIRNRLITPTGFTDAKKQLIRLGLELVELDISEYAKLDGGLTCLSLRF